MIVIIQYVKGENPVLDGAVDWAVHNKLEVTQNWKNARFMVDEFAQFLRCLWHGFAVASMDCNGRFMSMRYECQVTMGDTRVYHVWVTLDEDCRGLHYGSFFPCN